MRIGIAAPIEFASLVNHLPNLQPHERKLGLGGTAVNIIIDGLISAGHKVTLFTLDRNVSDIYVLQGEYLKIIFGHFRSSARVKTFDFCYREFVQIKRFIESERSELDVINAHWSYKFAIRAILAKIPHVIIFRDDSPTILKLTKQIYRFTRLLMDFWVRKNGNHFTFNSTYLKSLINVEGKVIPNPIKDSEITCSRKAPAKNKVIRVCLIANGWDKRKNPEVAILAFSKLIKRYPNLELHLIGSGFEIDSDGYQGMEKLGVNKNVIYRGKLEYSVLLEDLSTFDVMLHTAREESFGNNLIEAMAKGIPVLGGIKAGAVPWVLADVGTLANIEDVDDVSSKLEKIIFDDTYCEQCSEKGIINVEQRFSQKEVIQLNVNEYSNAIKNYY